MRGLSYLLLTLSATPFHDGMPPIETSRPIRSAVYIDNEAGRPGDGTAERPYPSLHALSMISAQETDTVFVTGEYPFQVSLDPNLHSGVPERPFCLMAWPGRDPPTVRGLVTDRSSYLVIDGFVFRGARGRGGLGLFVNNSSDVIARNCVMTDNEEAGACLKGSVGVLLERCDLSGNIGGGLLLPQVEDVLVTGCTMCDNGMGGLLIDNALDSMVEGCVIEGIQARGRGWEGALVDNEIVGPLVTRMISWRIVARSNDMNGVWVRPNRWR